MAEPSSNITPPPAPLRFPGRPALTLDRPRIMGVLNVTPDSFSDGGRFDRVEAAVAHGLAMAGEGADLIDIGGESSRPGAGRIGASQQIERVAGVTAALRRALDEQGLERIILSVDTTRAAVAEAALNAGASMINDISAARENAAMLPLAAGRGVPLALMHMQGEPGTMQENPTYEDVVAEVLGYLKQRVAAAVAAGADPSQLLIDPGIGFGKSVVHNLALLGALGRFVATAQPVMLGVSRKRFLAAVQGLGDVRVEPGPGGGTAGVTALGVAAGVSVFRVHDVPLNRQAADVSRAIPR